MQEDKVSNPQNIAEQIPSPPVYKQPKSTTILKGFIFLFITSSIGSILGYIVAFFVVPENAGLGAFAALFFLVIIYSGIVTIIASAALLSLRFLDKKIQLTKKIKFLIYLLAIVLILLSAVIPSYLGWVGKEREKQRRENERLQLEQTKQHIIDAMPKFNLNYFENCKEITEFLNKDNVLINPSNQNDKNFLTQAFGFGCDGTISYSYSADLTSDGASNELKTNIVPFSNIRMNLIDSNNKVKEAFLLHVLIFVDNSSEPIQTNAPISNGQHSFKILYESTNEEDIKNIKTLELPKWDIGLMYFNDFISDKYKSNLSLKEPLSLSLDKFLRKEKVIEGTIYNITDYLYAPTVALLIEAPNEPGVRRRVELPKDTRTTLNDQNVRLKELAKGDFIKIIYAADSIQVQAQR